MAAPYEDEKLALHQDKNDLFRDEFKFYKKRVPPPDLSNVIDFLSPTDTKVYKLAVSPSSPDVPGLEGLKSPEQWKVYGYEEFPGFQFVCNPFLKGYQRYWVQRCLEDYPLKPNPCNLDAHMSLAADLNIWHTSLSERNGTGAGSFDQTLIHKLRWVTLGYHHDWNTKVYSAENITPFPADLTHLSAYIAAVLGFHTFKAEASIINFYHTNSTLAGHTDHSEFDLQAPLFSISFGQPAIFLLGGTTRAERPVAMYIRSGDMVVMSGQSRLAYHAVPKILASPHRQLNECFEFDQDSFDISSNELNQDITQDTDCIDSDNSSRPNIAPCKCFNTGNILNGKCVETINSQILRSMKCMKWNQYEDYLRTSRINMNTRQVLEKGQEFPTHQTLKESEAPKEKLARLEK